MIKWDEPKPPTSGESYNYVKANTPLGVIKIEWKSWKSSPTFDIEIDGIWIGYGDNLIEAKKDSLIYLGDKRDELIEFLK